MKDASKAVTRDFGMGWTRAKDGVPDKFWGFVMAPI